MPGGAYAAGQLTQSSERLREVDILLVGGTCSAVVHGLGGSDGAGKRGEVLERLVGGRAGQREAGSREDFPEQDVVLGGRGRELTRCWDKRHGHDQLAAASDGANRRRPVQNSRRTHAPRSEPGKHAIPARSEGT